MTRWLAPIAVGLALAFVVLVALLVLRPGAEPTASQRADRLAAELRCPDCEGLSVADSPTAAAREIRRQVGELIAGGATDTEVRSHFVDRYGAWILLAPGPGIAWLVPWAVAVAAILGLVLLVTRRRAGSERARAPTTQAADGPERRRVREEAEALDA